MLYMYVGWIESEVHNTHVHTEHKYTHIYTHIHHNLSIATEPYRELTEQTSFLGLSPIIPFTATPTESPLMR